VRLGVVGQARRDALPRELAVSARLRGLRCPDPGPVHPTRGPGPGVARRLPQVRRLPAVPRRDVHLLCARRQDLLQARLRQAVRRQVLQVPAGLQPHGLRDAGPAAHLPPGLLSVPGLRPAAHPGRRVRAARRRPLLQGGPRRARQVRGSPRRRRAAGKRHTRGTQRGTRAGEWRTGPPWRRRVRPTSGAHAGQAATPGVFGFGWCRSAGPAGAAQADSGADGAEREAAAHAAHLLRGQPEAGRAHEGAAGRDDGPVAQGHQGLVPEQALQGQEEEPPHEADAAARKGRSSAEPGRPPRRAHGGQQPRAARGQRQPAAARGARVPTSVEGARRVRHAPAGRGPVHAALPAPRQP
ncbi:hypothetical protein HPB47_004869, partial [Ixodes persulcatus]